MAAWPNRSDGSDQPWIESSATIFAYDVEHERFGCAALFSVTGASVRMELAVLIASQFREAIWRSAADATLGYLHEVVFLVPRREPETKQ